MAVGSLENTSQNLSDSGFLNHELLSSGKDTISSSSEVDSGREKGAPLNIQSSYPTDLKKSSEHEENSIEERGFDQHNPQPTDYLGSKINDINIRLESFLKLCQQGRESLKLSDMMEDCTESTDLDTTSEMEAAGGVYAFGHGNIFRSTARNSYAYDASVSSDDGCSDRDFNNPTVLPEGTFAHKKVMDLTDAKRKEADEDGLRKRWMATDTAAQLQNFPAKQSNEMLDLAAMGWFDSKHKIHASKWRTSLYSENFHSLQNTLEPESEGSPRTPSRDEFSHGRSFNQPYVSSSAKLKSFEHEGMKILQKVGELRDELNELFDKAVEGKGRPQRIGIQQESFTKCLNSNLVHHPPKQNRSTRIPFPEGPCCSCLHCHQEAPKISMQLPPNICCGNDGLYRACAMEADFPPCCHKSKGPNGESEKLHSNEKRQPVKQYCRPVFRGAPFVICHNCLALLKLPVDFSTSRKGLHKLQCGACSKVLLFSYRSRTYTVPSTPTEARHPPSAVDSGAETSTVNEISASHINGCHLEGPFSYSELYGLSFSMSSSAEVEPPLHVSRNSSDMTEERDGKRLHGLMGCSSATETMRQILNADDEYEGMKQTMHCRGFYEEEFVEVDSKGKGIFIADHSPTSTSIEIHEKDEWPKRSRTWREGSHLERLLKKRIREVTQSLKITKLLGHSNGSSKPNS